METRSEQLKRQETTGKILMVIAVIALGMSIYLLTFGVETKPAKQPKPARHIEINKTNETAILKMAYDTGYYSCLMDIAEVAIENDTNKLLNCIETKLEIYNKELKVNKVLDNPLIK